MDFDSVARAFQSIRIMEISQYGLDFDAAAAAVTTAAIAWHFEKRFSIDGKRMSNAANNHRFKSKWNDTYANSTVWFILILLQFSWNMLRIWNC